MTSMQQSGFGLCLLLLIVCSTAGGAELMQGSPPAAEALVSRANWREPPFNRWSLQHVERLLPTATVDRGSGQVSPLPSAPVDLSSFEFADHLGKRRTIEAFLADQYVDALLLWSDGKIRFETYRNHQTDRTRHMMFSVTKSFTGLLAEMLIEDGAIEGNRTPSSYVPELQGSAYEDATVRNALDMEVGIDYTEIYDDPRSTIFQFHYAAGYRIPPPGTATYPSLWAFLPTLQKKGEHGQDFHYVTANSEVLGWVIERVTGKPLATHFEDRIYSRIGAERDAFYVVDPHGKSISGGGLNATARDMLRLALVVSGFGVHNDTRIVQEAVVRRIAKGGTPRPGLWGNENGGTDNSYKSQWYYHHPSNTLSALGVHGQSIHMTPGRDIVMILQSSHPVASGEHFAVTDDFYGAVSAELGRLVQLE